MKNLIRILVFLCVVGSGLLLFPASAEAATPGSGSMVVIKNDGGSVDWIKDDPDNDVFYDVTNKAQDTSKSAYKLISVIAGAVFILCMMLAGIMVMLTKNQNARSENKGWLMNIILGMAVIACAFMIYGIIMSFSTSLSNSSSKNNEQNTTVSAPAGGIIFDDFE